MMRSGTNRQERAEMWGAKEKTDVAATVAVTRWITKG